MNHSKSKSLHPDTAASEPSFSTTHPPESCERPVRLSLSTPPSALAALVTQRHAQLAHLNHFELLGVPENADRATIRRAFQQAVRQFHPDLLSAEHEQLRPLAKEIVCRIGAAYRVLDNDADRAQYRRGLQQYPHLGALRYGSRPSPRPSNPALRASSMPSPRPSNSALRTSSIPSPRESAPDFRPSQPPVPASATSLLAVGWTPERAFAAAKIQLERGVIEQALALIEQACIAEPEHPQYRALHAWLRVQRGELTPGPVADEILTTLTWAVRERRNDLDIRMYRARVLQRLGKKEEAIRDFSVVASMDEKNLEAVREIRLHRAREEQRQSTAASGMLERIFKGS